MGSACLIKNANLANSDLSTKIIADIQHLLDMASFYTDEDNQEIIHIVELTKMLTQALGREPSLEGKEAIL